MFSTSGPCGSSRAPKSGKDNAKKLSELARSFLNHKKPQQTKWKERETIIKKESPSIRLATPKASASSPERTWQHIRT